MSVKLISVKCPECNAVLNIEEGRTQAFCTYCGAKVLINNENEYIYRTVDEAGIKQAETERIVKLKRLEYAERKRQAAEKSKAAKIKISLILGIVGILMMTIGFFAGSASGDSESGFYFMAIVGLFPLMGAGYIWLFSSKKEDDIDFDDTVKVPETISDYESKNYAAIETILRSAGFTNITSVPLNDLTVGLFAKPGRVESITINGKRITSGGKKFLPDASVVIAYHSMQE